MYIENNIFKNRVSTWLILMFFLIALMIVVGGLTRLTDSGLSITKWELFSGILPPLNNAKWLDYFEEYKLIPEFKIQNYSMTLSEFKIIFWWEWAHRFLGRLIGLIFLIPLIYFSIKIGFKKLTRLYLIFILICFQGFIGWYMVESGLIDNLDVSHFRLSIHLLFAFIILSLVLWNFFLLNHSQENRVPLINFLPEFILFLIFIQIIIGAFVSGMDAGKIYNSWPLMGNSYFPDDNEISNLLKISAFSDPSLVQFLHRNLAYLTSFIYIFLLYKIFKKKIFQLIKPVIILGLIILLQIFLGILTVLNGATIIIASLHQFSSILLVSSALYFLFKNRFS
ncbi:COX15/CtaA family protein [Candidatus Pelagibacter sp.]|nr:COX15/CtaA family protein [Candidatus Pelagibacter sp.]MDC3135706.1 COX15/CtaA family protein [Candidatus Pelagibacter sp.]